MNDNYRKKNVSDTKCKLPVNLEKKLLKFYDTVLKYLLSKKMKNHQIVAIFVNIVFLVLR